MDLKELDYKFENVGQFRAIMSNEGYSEEYNNGILKYTKADTSFTLNVDEVKKNITQKSDILPLQTTSQSSLSQLFDVNKATNDFDNYKTDLKKNHNISLIKLPTKEGENAKDFIIVDNNSKIAYDNRAFYDHSLRSGYILDGEGTQLEKGQYSKLKNNPNNKLGKYYRGEDNSLKFYPQQPELIIPKTIYGQELTKENIAALKNGEYVAISRKNENTIFIKVDKELNSITIRNLKDLNIPNEIAGHKLSDIDKSLLANGKHTTPLIMENNGNYFTAEVAIDGKELIFKNTQSIPKEIALQMRAELSEKKQLTNLPENKLAEPTPQLAFQNLEKDKNVKYILTKGLDGLENKFKTKGDFNNFLSNLGIKDLYHKYSKESLSGSKGLAKGYEYEIKDIITDRINIEHILTKGLNGLGDRFETHDKFTSFLDKLGIADLYYKCSKESLSGNRGLANDYRDQIKAIIINYPNNQQKQENKLDSPPVPEQSLNQKVEQSKTRLSIDEQQILNAIEVNDLMVENQQKQENQLNSPPVLEQSLNQGTQEATMKGELSIDDLKALNAIKTNDFQTIHEMVTGGYKPSENLMKEVDSLKLEETTKIGVERLLGVEKQQKQKAILKETLDPEKGKNNIKQPLLNTTNALMNNM